MGCAGSFPKPLSPEAPLEISPPPKFDGGVWWIPPTGVTTRLSITDKGKGFGISGGGEREREEPRRAGCFLLRSVRDPAQPRTSRGFFSFPSRPLVLPAVPVPKQGTGLVAFSGDGYRVPESHVLGPFEGQLLVGVIAHHFGDAVEEAAGLVQSVLLVLGLGHNDVDASLAGPEQARERRGTTEPKTVCVWGGTLAFPTHPHSLNQCSSNSEPPPPMFLG